MPRTGRLLILVGMTTQSLSFGSRPTVDTPPPHQASKSARTWWLGIAACLVLAALLRLWGAAANSGLGNTYYAATALSMSQDWTTFLTGGLDTGHFISMDKPAVWLWPSALLIKMFGLNWATLFLPNVLAGVASVLVLALAVREGAGDRPAGRAVAVLAGLGLAISPMNVAVDRDNHPDTLMLLALLLAAWMTIRSIRRGKLLPLLGAAALVGLAFDAKYLQAYVVLPALALAFLVSGAGPVLRRLAWLGGAAVSVLAASAVWPLLAALVPAQQRPWTAASTDGTVLDRLTNVIGSHLAPPSGGQGGVGDQVLAAFRTGEVFHSGSAGPGRLFGGVLADQISWWLPLAVLGAVTMAIGLRGRPRTDPAVAAFALWSGWALCCWVVFSFMGGVLHPYYTGMLVPALAVLSAGGLVTAWSMWRRAEMLGTALLSAQVLVVAGWSVWVLLNTSARKPDWLIPVVAVAAGCALAGAVFAAGRRLASVTWVGVLAAVAALAAPVSWSVATANQQLLGLNPLANQEGRYDLAVLPPPLSAAFMAATQQQADPARVEYLRRNRGDARWIVATWTAMEAAPLILASGGMPVMAMGGFDGTDPTPTPQRLREFIGAGELRFVLAPPPGASFADFVNGPSVDAIRWALQECTPVAGGIAGAAGQPGSSPPQGPPQGPPQPILLDCQGAVRGAG